MLPNVFYLSQRYKLWCLNLSIPAKVYDYITANYEGCLCEKCIGVLIGEFEIGMHE
jgi:hypothetical protein